MMKIIRVVRRRLAQYLKTKRIAGKNVNGIRYHVDEVSLERITGWLCRQQAEAYVNCELSVFLNGTCIPNPQINIMREDLVSAGFGSGKHGFSVAVNWQQFEVGKNILELKVDEQSKVIIKLLITEKQMLVAMSQQICTHIDARFSELGER